MHTGSTDVWKGALHTGGLGVRVAPPARDCWWARIGLLQKIEGASENGPSTGQGDSRRCWSSPEAGIRHRARRPTIGPGDRVWVFCPHRKRGLSPKLTHHWQGPGEILDKISKRWSSGSECLDGVDVWCFIRNGWHRTTHWSQSKSLIEARKAPQNPLPAQRRTITDLGLSLALGVEHRGG